MIDRNTLIFICLLIAGVALNLLTLYHWSPSLISNDGIQYISTATNWLAGKGFSTNALIYGPHFQGTLPAIQTVWPPGYPFAISLISKLGFELKFASLILNLAMHAAVAALMWRILLRMGVDSFFTIACVLIFYVMALPWAYISAGLSEPLFTALLLCSMLLLPDPKKGNLFSWIACGLFLAACVLVRYSSVFIAFGTGTGILVYMLFYERRPFASFIKPGFKLALLVALPALAFCWLMHRTHTLIGSLDRYAGTKVPETVFSTVKRWAVKSSELLGFHASETSNGPIAIFWFAVFALLVAALVVVFLSGSRNYLKRSTQAAGKADGIAYIRLFTLTTLFHSLALILYLSANSIKTTPLEIITRYLYQIYPCLYAVFCYMLFKLFHQYDTGRQRTILKMTTSVLVAIYLIAQLNSLRVTRPVFFRDAMITDEMLNLPARESVSVKEFIKRCFTDEKHGKTLWSPHAQPIHLHTGIPTISQSINYTDKPFNPDAFKKRITQYEIGMFIFVDFLNYPIESHDRFLRAAKNWLSNNNYFEVELLSNQFGVNRTVEIYTTNPQCDDG